MMHPNLIALAFGIPGGAALSMLFIINPPKRSTPYLIMSAITGVLAACAFIPLFFLDSFLSLQIMFMIAGPGMAYRAIVDYLNRRNKYVPVDNSDLNELREKATAALASSRKLAQCYALKGRVFNGSASDNLGSMWEVWQDGALVKLRNRGTGQRLIMSQADFEAQYEIPTFNRRYVESNDAQSDV